MKMLDRTTVQDGESRIGTQGVAYIQAQLVENGKKELYFKPSDDFSTYDAGVFDKETTIVLGYPKNDQIKGTVDLEQFKAGKTIDLLTYQGTEIVENEFITWNDELYKKFKDKSPIEIAELIIIHLGIVKEEDL